MKRDSCLVNPVRYRFCRRFKISFSRNGVTGSCVTAPGMPIASSIADAMTAPTAVMPLSPPPLRPSGLSGLGASSVKHHTHVRHFAQGRQHVIGEGDGQRRAVLVVDELLEQRAAQPLHHAAHDLPLDQHRVDRHADIVRREVTLDLDATGFAIDVDHRRVGAVGKRLVQVFEHAVGGQPGLAPLRYRRRRRRRRRQRQRLRRLRHLRERDRGAVRPVLAHDAGVHDIERIGVGFHEVGSRDFERLRAHFQRGDVGGRAGHHRHPRRMRAEAVIDAVGAAVDHAHVPVIHPERGGADLRDRRFDALSQRSAAGDHLDGLGAVHRDPHAINRAEAALLQEKSDSGADRLARRPAALEFLLQLVPAEAGEHLVEQSRVVAGIEYDGGAADIDRPLVRHRGRRDQVAAARLDRLDAELRGDRVQHPFLHESGFITPGGAVGGGRRLVGQAVMPGNAVGGYVVRPGQHARGAIGHARAVGPHVSALVVEEFVVEPEDASFGIDRHANFVPLLAGMVAGHQVLAAVLDPFHRPSQLERRGADEHVLRVDLAAHAEAAADVAFVKVHGRGTAAEHAREKVAVRVRALGGAVKLEHVVGGVVTGDRAARLHRHAGVAADGQVELDHRARGAERRFDIAVLRADDGRLGVAARLEFARRLARRHDDGQFLVAANHPPRHPAI